MINWMSAQSEGSAILNRILPRRKPGQEDSLDWEFDLVDVAEVIDSQSDMFHGLAETKRKLEAKVITMSRTKIQLADKDIHLELVDQAGKVIVSSGGSIRYVQLPVTDKAIAQTVRVILGDIDHDKAKGICASLGRFVGVKFRREAQKADLTIVRDEQELPELGSLVTGRDTGGAVRVGLVTGAVDGAIEIQDFRDRHVLRELATVTELASADDVDVDDHMSRYQAEVEEIGQVPSYGALLDAIVIHAAEGGVAPSSASTTYLNGATIDMAVQTYVESLPEAGTA